MSSTPRKPKHKPAGDPLAEYRELERKLRPTRRPAEPEPAPAPAAAEFPHRYDDLLEVAVSLASTLDLKDILDRIVDGIIRVTRCERGFLMLREPDGSFPTFTGRTRDNLEWDELSAREISRSIVSRVVDTHEPFIETDLEHVRSGSIHQQKILAAVCLPLIYKNELIGVIYADSGRIVPKFVEADRKALRAFSAQAALAVDNARRHGEIKVRHDRLEEQNVKLRHQLARQFSVSGMISKSKRMLDVFETVEKIAPTDIAVLIEGESGTGKELLARAVHEKSPRSSRPFEAVNCASLPAGLVESTFFGHRKGAFTNADYDKPGVFEIADGGTLFLDEIGDMSLDIQAKLLRVLQEKEVKRVGEEGRVRKVDVRVISATNMDLKRAVAEGRFREDLYFRLAGARIPLPPLRERPEDIVPLAEYFLGRLADEKQQPHPTLSGPARALLTASAWAGNVRQLKSAVEWGFAFQDGDHVVHARDLERFLSDGDSGASVAEVSSDALDQQVDQFEERVIRRKLAENEGHVSKTARDLHVSRQQLYVKMKKYRIPSKPE